jgi:uncharacterized protein (DUF934 family)
MNNVIRVDGGSAQIVQDDWQLVRSLEAPAAVAGMILPFPVWVALHAAQQDAGPAGCGVWLAPDDNFEAHWQALVRLPLLAVEFPSFRDGRGYSTAYLLRKRHGYAAELRAIGDVLRDQLFFMHRCGFNSFAIAPGKDVADALKGLDGFSVRYQGAADDPVPLFRRRASESDDDANWEP